MHTHRHTCNFAFCLGVHRLPQTCRRPLAPQLDVSGLLPSGNRWGWGGCKCPLSALEPSPLPPSNTGSSQPSLSLDPQPLHTRRDFQTLRTPPPLASPQPAGSLGCQEEGGAGAPPRAHTQLILGGCCLDKMRWERSRLRGRSHLAGICSLHVCPAFFGSSSTFEKPRFRFWPKRPRSPGDPGAGKRSAVACTTSPPTPAPSPANFQGPLFRRTFFFFFLLALSFDKSGLPSTWPGGGSAAGRCCKRGRGENAGAPLAPGRRRWLAVGSLVGGVCVRGEGLVFLASAYSENRYLDWGRQRARSVVGGVGALAAEGQKDQLREGSGAGSCCCLPWRRHGEPWPWSPSVARKQEAPWQMLLGMAGFVCLF